MRTTTVAAAVIIEQGKVLVTRRLPRTHLAGLWEFPGGKVEENEDPERTVVRECEEECGIEIRVIDILDVTFHHYETKNVLLLFYLCARISGEVRDIHIAEHRFCDADELLSLELPPPDARVVQKILSRLKT